MTTVKSCPTKDCLLNDKKNNCTAEEIELNYHNRCTTFKSDKKWLDAQLHEGMKKYLEVPIHDNYEHGLTIVEIDKDKDNKEGMI